MAAIEAKKLSKEEHDELSCVYASLILQDENIEVTSDKLGKLLSVTRNTVEPYWPSLFAKALKGMKVLDLVSNMGSAPQAQAPASTNSQPEAKKDDVVPEKPADEPAPNIGGLFGDE